MENTVSSELSLGSDSLTTSDENSDSKALKDLTTSLKKSVNNFFADINDAKEKLIKNIAILERHGEEMSSDDKTTKLNINSGTLIPEENIKTENIETTEEFMIEESSEDETHFHDTVIRTENVKNDNIEASPNIISQLRSTLNAPILDQHANVAIRSEEITTNTVPFVSIFVTEIKKEAEEENVVSETDENIIVPSYEEFSTARDSLPKNQSYVSPKLLASNNPATVKSLKILTKDKDKKKKKILTAAEKYTEKMRAKVVDKDGTTGNCLPQYCTTVKIEADEFETTVNDSFVVKEERIETEYGESFIDVTNSVDTVFLPLSQLEFSDKNYLSENSNVQSNSELNTTSFTTSQEAQKTNNNRMAKKRLLESSDSALDGELASDGKEENFIKQQKIIKKEKKDTLTEDEKKNEEINEKNRRKSNVLTVTTSDSEAALEDKKIIFNSPNEIFFREQTYQSNSDDEESLKKKKQRDRRVFNSDFNDTISSQDNSFTDSLDERYEASRRKRIKTEGSENDSENDGNSSQGTPQVAGNTKQEEERLKRITENQKLINTMYEAQLTGRIKFDKLVLDFDKESMKPRVSVKDDLMNRLKSHQVRGILFMWKACFESIERLQSTKGSGCILAHCSGLGKKFQIVTLLHTIIANVEIGIRTVLIVCSQSTVLNWTNEFKIWLKNIDDGNEINVYNEIPQRMEIVEKQLALWHETGGVMIINNNRFKYLTQNTASNKFEENIQDNIIKYLINPGLIVCDQSRLNDAAIWQAMDPIKTQRRIILTPMSLNNNLMNYYSMLQFVKPNILGTKTEFQEKFLKPITNGQKNDSTEKAIELMNKQTEILSELLEGTMQRFDYSVLTSLLPPKQEYVILVKLTELQIKLYQDYIDNNTRKQRSGLPLNFDALQRICTRGMVQINAEQVDKINDKNDYEDIKLYPKLQILFGILKKCEEIGDKLLVFSNHPNSLALIEKFLKIIDTQSTKRKGVNNLDGPSSRWALGLDYLRLDGEKFSDNKQRRWCDIFNDPSNTRARLSLISSKAGILDYNFTAANRVIIFEASFFNIRDIQNMLRIYRIGQEKHCYIYRLLAAGTMEEKMYNQPDPKLSLSDRLDDEQHIRNRYSKCNLDNLYKLELPSKSENIINLPKDKLLAEIFLECKDIVVNYHERDSRIEDETVRSLDEEL